MNGVSLSSNTWKTLIDSVVVDVVLVGLKSNTVELASFVLMIGAGLRKLSLIESKIAVPYRVS
jgi:hypothetical protein